MGKISIVHIAQSEGAGVTDYIKMLIRGMDKNRYNVSIIGSYYYENERKYFEDNGCKLRTLAMERKINILKDLGCMLKLRRLIKALRPDILHVHSSKAGVIARIANIGLSSKVIYNAHGWSFNMKASNEKKYFYACIERTLAKFTKVIVNISDNEYETAIKVGIPTHKMIVIKNAIDTKIAYDKYNKLSIFEELHIPKDAYVIGICGRICKQKAPHIFIEVCSEITKRIPNAYFLMIGDGELKDDVMKLANKHHIDDKLRITGWTHEPQKYISILNIALLTSKWEGFGLVLLQYMLQQKPVIAAEVGGISEIVKHEQTGMLVHWNDVNNYVNNILRIKNDEALRCMITKNAYEMVTTQYNIEQLVKKHEELYDKVAE